VFEEPCLYRGPFVILQPDPMGYRVSVEPSRDGENFARTYREKNDAWRYAQDLWTALRAPLRDLTEGNTGRTSNNSQR
jgi:hypothetical protein